MNTYTLFWLTGESELIHGSNISNAFSNAGYGGGAINALDFYSSNDDRKNWIWNSIKRSWEKRVKPSFFMLQKKN